MNSWPSVTYVEQIDLPNRLALIVGGSEFTASYILIHLAASRSTFTAFHCNQLTSAADLGRGHGPCGPPLGSLSVFFRTAMVLYILERVLPL